MDSQISNVHELQFVEVNMKMESKHEISFNLTVHGQKSGWNWVIYHKNKRIYYPF